MILSLDHIAVAVPDLDEAVARFCADLGLSLEGTEDVVPAKTRTAFLPVAGPTTIELVTPLNGEGPIAASLEKRGPGLHHLCTTDAPTPGAHGTQVIFVHPRSTGGVLIELAQHPVHP